MLKLVCHPEHRASRVQDLSASVLAKGPGKLVVSYVVGCGGHLLNVGHRKTAERVDNLWQTTCFEIFVKVAGQDAYLEYNFAPSGDWATYSFTGYRAGMEAPEVAVPKIGTRAGGQDYIVDVEVDLPPEYHNQPLQLAISAVVEEQQGPVSYWALAHGGGPADFHDPACFIHQLAAAGYS